VSQCCRTFPPTPTYEQAKDPKRFVLVEGGSHHNTNRVGREQYRVAIRELFGIGRDVAISRGPIDAP
jgi:hypothetical protein